MKRSTITPTILDPRPSFARHLRAVNLRPKTEATYGYALQDLARFPEASGMPRRPRP